MKRRRKITIETEKIVIRGDLPEFNWCESCGSSGPKVTAEQAAILAGEPIEHLYRRAAQGQVHSTRTPGGLLMICLRSLSARLAANGRHNSDSVTPQREEALRAF